MAFRPNAHDTLTIGDTMYVIAEHPAAPGMPYGQEGRAGIVYRLLSPLPEKEDGDVALKVLRPRFRTPSLVSQAEKLETYAALPGLQVCRRTVLTRIHHANLLQRHPDLIYAVLMPWIAGPTWLEVLLDKRPFTFEQALSMARAFAEILESMELRGIAHCDLSGPNVLLPALVDHGPQTAGSSSSSAVALVDVEGLYAPGLLRPEALPSGSSGYAHRTAHEGLWSPTADRFAGAILLAEMLGWGDENVRSAAWSETYFNPDEMPGRASASTPHPERYQILLAALRRLYGENVASLLERAWHSETLADCPTFGEWLVALPENSTDHELQTTEDQPHTIVSPEPFAALLEKTTDYELQTSEDQPQTIEPPPIIGEPSEDTTAATIRALMQAGRSLEEENNLVGALAVYRQAQSLATIEPGLLVELSAIVQDLEQRVRQTNNLSAAGQTPSLQKEEPVFNVGEASDVRNPMPSIEPMPALSDDKGELPCLAETPQMVSGKPGWRFVVLWILTNAIGGTLGLIAADASWRVGIGDVFWVTFWTLTGLAQWIAVRKYVLKAGWWILASVIGGIVAQAAIYVMGSIANDIGLFNVPALVYFVMIGISVGSAQWLLVLGKRLRKAGWWVVTIAISVVVAMEMVPVIINALGIYFNSLYGVLLGTLIGILSGPVLLWLFNNPRAKEVSPCPSVPMRLTD